jgi:hypothetical protein
VTSGGNTIVYANATSSSESISGHHVNVDMQINLMGVTAPTPRILSFITHLAHFHD